MQCSTAPSNSGTWSQWSCGLLLGRRGRCSDALAQFHHPAGNLLVLAGDRDIPLELIERLLRLSEVQVVEHAQVQMRRGIVGLCRYRTLIGRFGFRKFAELALDDA